MKKVIILTLGLMIFGSTSGVALAAPQTRTLDLPCVQNAVATREASIQKAFSGLSASITTALQNRASSLNTAWGITDGPQRRAARKTAWEEYRISSQSARTAFRTEKKTAWETFKTASKTCKVEVVESEENDNII